MRRIPVTSILVVCTVAIFAAACTSDHPGLLPTAASPIDAAASAVTPADQTRSSTTIDRSTPAGVVREAATVAAWTSENWAFDMAADLQVEGSGPIGSVSGSCPSALLTIYGIDVEVNAATSYPMGSACSGLAPGRVVRVRGLLYLAGGAMRVLATEITIEGGVNRPVEGEGVLTELTGSCPARTLVLRGVSVMLGGGTAIRWRNTTAATCADLQIGMLLNVQADVTPTGSIIASRVTIQNGTPPPTNTTPVTPTTPPTPTGPRPQEPVAGAIVGKTGSCPSVTFKFGDRYAKTTTTTTYSGGTCTDLLVGVRVEVQGTADTEGKIITATRIIIVAK